MLNSARSPAHAVGRGESPHLVSFDPGRTVLWLRGEHDIATVAALSDTLARVIAADDADVVVDLRRVSFIDAATIGALVDGRMTLARMGRRFALRSPSTCAMDVLILCELADLVEAAPGAPDTGQMPT